MELDEIADKYRAFKPQLRYGLIFIIGILPAVNYWVNTGDALEVQKADVEASYQAERQNFENARQKAAELPAREAQLSEIEGELVKAKEFLPDKIELDVILGFIGNLEKELDVQLVKFTPLAETTGKTGGEYKELPVELTLKGTFVNTMRFMDRLVHMQSLTHLRNIKFTSTEVSEEDRKKDPTIDTRGRVVESTSKLIIFKGI